MSAVQPIAEGAGGRLDVIDFWRGVAIVAVYCVHALGFAYQGVSNFPFTPEGWLDLSSPPRLSFYAVAWATVGWFGLPLFFVLSGFCIQISVRNRPEGLRVGEYLVRRFFRIAPAFALMVVILCVLRWDSLEGGALHQLWTHLLFVHNVSSETRAGLSAPWWSVAVEVQLYLAFPLVHVLMRRHGAPAALLFVAVVTLISRAATTPFIDWELSASDTLNHAFLCAPLNLWFDWTLGAYMAERFLRGESFPGLRHLAWVVPLAVLSIIYLPMLVAQYSIFAVLFSILMFHSLRHGLPRWTAAFRRTLTFVGVVSYSLFLVHEPLMRAFHAYLLSGYQADLHPLAVFCLILVGLLPVTGLAALLYYLVERPANRYGHRLAKEMHGP